MEQRVMVHPHDADGRKACCVGEIQRPQRQQALSETAAGHTRLRLRHVDLEDQQRDRYREDAIAECLETVLVHRSARRDAGASTTCSSTAVSVAMRGARVKAGWRS